MSLLRGNKVQKCTFLKATIQVYDCMKDTVTFFKTSSFVFSIRKKIIQVWNDMKGE